MTETFRHRWGAGYDRDNFTDIPNDFFRHYAKIITREEFLFICHLASYKYNVTSGASMPSLETVAAEMGYQDVRSVQRLRQSLEEKACLTVEYRRGFTSIYDFGLLSSKIRRLAEGGDNHATSTGDTGVTGVVTTMPPEEEEVRTRIKEPSPPSAVLRINVSQARKNGYGASAFYQAECPICGMDVKFFKIGGVTECLDGHVSELVKDEKESISRLYHPNDMGDVPVARAYRAAVEVAKRDTQPSDWFKGFRKRSYLSSLQLLIERGGDAEQNWKLWLERRFEEGIRGNALVVAALRGLEWAEGGPPPGFKPVQTAPEIVYKSNEVISEEALRIFRRQ